MAQRIVSFALSAALAGVLGLSGLAMPAGAAQTAGSRAAGVRLFVTPARVVPGSRVGAVVHLRGLQPALAVAVQINPPAPAMGTLVDIHTRANASGAVDQPITFSALPPGAYVVFVNLGAYADARSSVPGSSVKTTLLVAASLPLLTVPCGAPLESIVACQLSGYGFRPFERVAIVYRVAIRTPRNGYDTTIYRRTALTDEQGSFMRPVLRFRVDPRVLAYKLTVMATGARGDHATIGTLGTP